MLISFWLVASGPPVLSLRLLSYPRLSGMDSLDLTANKHRSSLHAFAFPRMGYAQTDPNAPAASNTKTPIPINAGLGVTVFKAAEPVWMTGDLNADCAPSPHHPRADMSASDMKSWSERQPGLPYLDLHSVLLFPRCPGIGQGVWEPKGLGHSHMAYRRTLMQHTILISSSSLRQ